MSARVKGFFGTLRGHEIKNHRDDREKTCDSLFQMLQSVYDLGESTVYITHEQAKSLRIRVEDMALVDNDDGYTLRPSEEFFRPLSIEALNACPLDENDKGAKRLSELVRGWSGMVSFLEENYSTLYGELGSKLLQLANARRRVGTGENATSTTLLRMNKWRKNLGIIPDIINPYYQDMLKDNISATQRFFIEASCYSAYRREDEPHVSIILSCFYQGKEDISHAEVSTILAAMVTQLEHDKLESHSITPVLLISFMNFQGRILQAYATNDGLVIQKSKLCSFRTQEEFEKSMSLFLRWIASERVGDTYKQEKCQRGLEGRNQLKAVQLARLSLVLPSEELARHKLRGNTTRSWRLGANDAEGLVSYIVMGRQHGRKRFCMSIVSSSSGLRDISVIFP
ncbi:hypothetical protein DTO280E4_1683 [Paecilomyces variotii]|nr:hypothetical protein DTO280E4_1683 [Paecilomyces variotii]